ncbi:MAG: uroporphyrinogen decarboxylase family protein [Armatimonadota bacterium]
MTSKARVRAALAGEPVDRFPVTALYNFLYHQDHFSELTGRPPWELHRWLNASPEEHIATYRIMLDQAPFEILQPQGAPSHEQRERIEYLLHNGVPCRRDKRTGEYSSLATPGSGHAMDYAANETRRVFDRADIDSQVRTTPAQDIRASGCFDYLDAMVAGFGLEHYILSGGVVGTIYSAGGYVGQTNLFAMLIEEPDLVDYLCGKILEQNIESIRALAASGGDAVYIDESTATSDMISPAHYERFCLPYLQEMVREIHRLGHQAIVLYFGGVMDRLQQIAAAGADGVSVETSMKGYVNDIGVIADRIGGQVSLFGNIDPIGVLQNGTGEELAAEIARQAEAGRRARGFLTCTGSPITPGTPLNRVQRFLNLRKACKR